MRKRIVRVLLGVFITLVAALGWVGYKAYSVYNDVQGTYHPVERLKGEPKATPVPDILGNHRINFLALGSDNDRKAEERHPLTQSMIIISVDPVHNKVTLLSIPRDFWVPIPGHGMGKIDLAAKYGGIGLARATVERLFHINIDYYAWVGLAGFSKVIDDFDGVTINVTHPILDDFYPNDQIGGNPYATTRIFIPPGWRHLSGRQALEYVRSRHGDAIGDFGRSNRQQQVLLQLRKKADGWNLIFKIPQLASDLKDVVRTDVDARKLLDVARLARHIHPSDITRYVLSAPTYCRYGTTSDGQSILLPHWKVILPLTRRVFAPIQPLAPTPTPPPTATPKASPTPTTTPTAGPSPTPVPSPTPTPTPAQPTLNHLPGKLLYAAGGTIYQMDRNRRITDLLPSWMTAADMPVVAPDGRHLAFMRWAQYSSNIDIYNLRTHQVPRQITNDAASDPKAVYNYLWAAWPAWSPSGKAILFASDRYKLTENPGQIPTESRKLDLAIYQMNADGSNVRQLTTPAQGAGGDTDPQFRGHSTQFLYDHWLYHMDKQGLAYGQPYSQLVIADIANPAVTWTLTPPDRQIVQPALDRSGNRVAYVQAHGGISQLIVAHIVHTRTGPRLRNQKVIQSGEVAQPAFTPDGRWISYLQADGDGFSIYLEPVNGGPAIKLDEAGTGVDAISRPVWVR
jgi:LCP family protein required for cell wall assembly